MGGDEEGLFRMHGRGASPLLYELMPTTSPFQAAGRAPLLWVRSMLGSHRALKISLHPLKV